MNETLTFHLNCQRFEFVIYLDLDARKPSGGGGGGGDEDCEQQRRTLVCASAQIDRRLFYLLIGKHHVKTSYRQESGFSLALSDKAF